MNKFLSSFVVLMLAINSFAAEMGVPVQLKFKSPSGDYPDDNAASFLVQVLTPAGGCVLFEESYTNQTVVSGSISLALGSGTPGPNMPSPVLSLVNVYNNTAAKSNLECVDSNNVSTGSGQMYNPAATDTRVLRVRATIGGVPMVADFIQRATPYALQAESVGGKAGADILVQNSGTSLNQANLENIFANGTKLTKLQNLANSGAADTAATATSAGTSNYFTAALLGDVTGTQSATVVAGIRGVAVAVTPPVSGQVLAYNGSQYIPMTFTASAPVASVNGQQGAVVLNASHIAGVVTSASALLGDVTGNVSATVVSTVGGKNAASITATVNDVYAATTLPTMNTIAKRDGSGGLTASVLYAGDLRVNQGVKFYNITNTNRVSITAPGAFADYDLVLPANNGNPGEVLQTDGSGTLTWAAGASVTSASIVTALGFTPADDALVAVKANNLSDLTSATVARTNLGLGGAATLNVGTTAGTVAAGDDARIADALSETAFNASVSPATCTSAQTMYWNSVSSQFACVNILISGDVAGTASAVTVTKVQGVGVSFASIANNDILQYNGANVVNRAIPTCIAGEYLTFNGTVWSCATDVGGGGAVTSISVVAPISSTGGLTPTLSIAQANGSTNGYLSSADWTTFNSKITSSVASVVAVLGYTPANSATVSALSTTVSNKITSSAASIAEVLGYTPANPATVTAKITSSAASVAEVLGYVPASATSMSGFMVKTNNLSDLASSASARANLGLGGFATVSSLDLGSASATGTLAEARLPNQAVTSGTQYTKVTVDGKGRVTSATQLTLSDVTTALGYTPANNSASGTYLVKASNLSDVASATVARTNLGLGGAATLNVGAIAGTVAAGDDSRITGALSSTNFNTYVGSAGCTSSQTMYWNSVSSQFLCTNILISGDVTGTASAVTVTRIQGVGASFTALASNHILQYNGTNIINRAIPTCVGNQYLTFNGTAWSCATDVGSGGIVSSVTVAAPLQSTGGSAPTLSMTQATGSVSGYLSGTDWTTFNNKITSATAAITQVLGFSPANSATILVKSNNLSDLVNVVVARANLGLGGFATVSSLDLGSASATGTLAAARMPALTGDVTSTVGTVGTTVEKIRGVTVNATAPTTGQALIYNGSEWVATPAQRSTRVTANQTINGTTYTDVTNMAFTVVNGRTYKFKFNIMYAVSTTTRGLRLRINHPGATNYSVLYSVPGSTTAGTGYIAAMSYDASGDTFTASTATPSGIQFATAEGVIVATADGTVRLVASQSNTGNLIIYAGSVVEFREIP